MALVLQLSVNPAVGGVLGTVTVTVCDTVSVAPPSSPTMSVTVKSVEAATAYVCVGFGSPDLAPSPKSQAYAAIVPGAASVLVLVNVQSRPVQALVNSAVGGVFPGTGAAIVIVCFLVWLRPGASCTVRLTSNEP